MKKMIPMLIGAGLVLSALDVSAQVDADRQVEIKIRSQILRDALNEWARQADFQLISPSSGVTSQFLAPTVTGRLRPRAALERLLAGTSLTYELLDERTVVIRDRSMSGADAAGLRTADESARLRLAFASDESRSERIESLADALTARDENASRASGGEFRRGDLEEVLVTAQRREERLQDVPISISVLSGRDLDKATAEGVTEALSRVPGVSTTINWQGGGTQLAMRGVTAGGPLFNGSSPIAYYLDSVPFGLIKTAIAPDSNAYDLQRVEVLRGPQGTLYGASALNGVVRVLTQNPDFNEFEFKARSSLSTTETTGENYRGDIAVNVPIAPGKLAARAVVGYQNLSGWIDRPNNDKANDAEIRNARVKVNARPIDDLTIGVSAWVSRADAGSPPTSADGKRNFSTVDEPTATDYDAFGLKVDYTLAGFSVTSMTSYLDYRNEGDVDFFVFTNPLQTSLFTALTSEVLSQEVTLNSTHEGPWRWSVGGIYRDAEDRLVQTLILNPAPTDYSDVSESFAVFGEVTRTFVDGKVELTVGLRHFEDDVTQIENVPHTGASSQPLERKRATFDADTPRLVLTWRPGDDLSVYGSYSQGFRSGFHQYPTVTMIAPDFPPLQEDTLTNYEIGAKGSLWRGLVNFDAAIYYIDWQDVQQTLTVDYNGAPFIAVVNGESASGVGFDFSAVTQPFDRFEIGFNFSWNELSWDRAVFSGGVLLFDEGDRLNYSSQYTLGASTVYGFPIGVGDLAGRVSASVNYGSEQNHRTILGGSHVAGVGDPMTIARAAFSIESSYGWATTLFVDNVSNERGTPIRPYGIADWNPRVRPRTVGLQLEYRF